MGAVRAICGHVDDAEPDFRLGPAWAATSRTVTFGEPSVFSLVLPTLFVNAGRAPNSANAQDFAASGSLCFGRCSS